MYAVQVIVVPAQPASPTDQRTSTGEYNLPDHLICVTDHVINYIPVSALAVPPEVCHIEEIHIQVAKECPEIAASVTPLADQPNNMHIHVILVTLICVILLIIMSFGAAFLLFFGGFLKR
jgi:hypothetical protein